MNLSTQIELIRKIYYLSKKDISINLKLEEFYLEIEKYLSSNIRIAIRREIRNSITTLVGIYYRGNNDCIFIKCFSSQKEFQLDNISQIIQDYEELDINQFILIHGRELFGKNNFLLDSIYDFMLEFDNELS